MTFKRTAFALAATTMLAVSAFAAGALSSGLKPGSEVGAFDVVDVSGPNKGKQLCYRCNYGGAPVVAAFVKPNAPEAEFIVTQIQKLTEEHKAHNLRSFVVYMAGPESKPSIQKLTTEKNISMPVTFLPQGTKSDDIAAYKINPEASSTILMWNKGVVKSNFVNVDKAKWAEVTKAAGALLQ